MEPRDIVRRAIRFEGPPRLPVNMGSVGVSDLAGLPLKRAAGFRPRVEGEDEWGCVWKNTEVPNMGQVVHHPLEDLSRLDRHPVPDYSDDSRYVDVGPALEAAEREGRYVTCDIFMVLFERMYELHGFEGALADLYADRPAMERLADRVVEVHLALVREMNRRYPGRIDGWTMSDDWGTQQSAFISLGLWMDFFYPRYRRLFDAMHGAGCDVWVHSCGKVNEIIEGYIRAGVDVVNLCQPRALGIEEIGRRYRGRISFHSLSDIQVTLPTGDPRLIEGDAEALMEHWATPRGGFVLADYPERDIGLSDPSAKRAMYGAFSRLSKEKYGEPLPPLPDVPRE